MAEKFQIKDLNLYYGDFHALKNINMNIREKEITAFIQFAVRLWKINLYQMLKPHERSCGGL